MNYQRQQPLAKRYLGEFFPGSTTADAITILIQTSYYLEYKFKLIGTLLALCDFRLQRQIKTLHISRLLTNCSVFLSYSLINLLCNTNTMLGSYRAEGALTSSANTTSIGSCIERVRDSDTSRRASERTAVARTSSQTPSTASGPCPTTTASNSAPLARGR